MRSSYMIIQEVIGNKPEYKFSHKRLKDFLNIVREETIKDCAYVAKTETQYVPAAENEHQTIVDTESILSLIKKLK